MYTIYSTEGLVLKSTPLGEANRSFRIFTRDFGTIDASAQGVREVQSKLRMHLQDFSLSRISLVHGKGGWKLTSAKEEKNFYRSLGHNEEKLKALASISHFLLRFLSGEEKDALLYEKVISGLHFLGSEDLADEAVRDFELSLSFLILNELGYISENKDFAPLLEIPSGFRSLDGVRPLVKAEIERAIEESGL